LSKNKVLGHFSYLHSVHILQKKFGEKILKTLNFIAVFEKVVIFRNKVKILFLKFSRFQNFQIFTNLDAKSNFFDIFVLISMFVLTKGIFFVHIGFKLPKI
jgi:hypothetical protein